MHEPQNEPPIVDAKQGEVHLDGPGIVWSTDTWGGRRDGERIIKKACQAAGQRVQQAWADDGRVLRYYGF